jgi:PAS domain-containing protein
MSLKEDKRIKAVDRFLKLEFSKEKELQEIVMFAAEICGTSTAAITLLAEDTQFLRFKHGLELTTIPRHHSFCNHVYEGEALIVVSDALEDIRFQSNPFVTGSPHFRFYAGFPLITTEGAHVGCVCVIDQAAKELTSLQKKMLQVLAKQVIQLMEIDISLQLLKEQTENARNSEIAMRSFFESSIDGYLLLGRNFEVLAFNKVWESHVRTQRELQLEKGKSMVHYLNSDNLSAFYTDYTKALKGTAVFAQRKSKIVSDYTWRILKFEPAFDAAGEIVGVTVNTRDVTTKVAQEETMEAQGQSLREIAFIQSHEFRKPVATILGLMQILTMEGHTAEIKELQLMEQAVQELDEKIKLVVSHTNKRQAP